MHGAKFRSSIVSVFQNAFSYYRVTNLGEGGLDLSHDYTNVHFEKP